MAGEGVPSSWMRIKMIIMTKMLPIIMMLIMLQVAFARFVAYIWRLLHRLQLQIKLAMSLQLLLLCFAAWPLVIFVFTTRLFLLSLQQPPQIMVGVRQTDAIARFGC